MRKIALLILTLAVISACSIEEEQENVAMTFKGVNETFLRTANIQARESFILPTAQFMMASMKMADTMAKERSPMPMAPST